MKTPSTSVYNEEKTIMQMGAMTAKKIFFPVRCS